MDNLLKCKQQIVDGIKQLRTSKSEAALESQKLRERLREKDEELGEFEVLKQAVKSMPETSYKTLPSALKSHLGKFRG
jgi:cell shape-determining protein MreC